MERLEIAEQDFLILANHKPPDGFSPIRAGLRAILCKEVNMKTHARPSPDLLSALVQTEHYDFRWADGILFFGDVDDEEGKDE